jgi:GH35 family endo-1,4-beta-xylanase
MMNSTPTASTPIARRCFLRRISATGFLLASHRAFAQESIHAPLRVLAGGSPLMGTSVQTQFDTLYTPEEIKILTSHFDSVTPENCMKWQYLCPKEGVYRFEPADRLVDFAAKHRQRVVGHTLIFNRDGNYPDWLFKDGEKEAGAKLVWKRLEDHAQRLMGRYAGRIHSWDVLNEFIEVPAPGYRETDLTRILGADYPERLFRIAAEVDPKAKLTYNDFSVEKPARLKAILAFVRRLRERGCRIDVVGSQSHLELDDKAATNLDNMIKQFAAEGFQCALTELDVDVIPRALHWNAKTREQASQQNPYANGCPEDILAKQAAVYGEVMDAVMGNRKHVDRVTVWGISDRHSWLNKWPWQRVNHGLLFDREARPKPAFHSIAAALGAK